VPALQPGEPVGTRYLVFVDDYFAIPSYRNRVLERLAAQLPLLAPEDRMAIVAFDGRKVEMLSSWTRSLLRLEAALEEARKRSAYGLQRRSEERRFDAAAHFDRRAAGLRYLNPRYPGPYGDADLYGGDGYRPLDGELDWQVERVVQGASSALRAFARPPGRKVMLVLSGGWPTWSLDGAAGTYAPHLGTADRGIFDPLIDTANRLGYTLYPVDLNADPKASHGGAEYGDLFTATVASEVKEARDRLEDDALVYLAGATGGRAFLDGARLRALERAIDDTRSYYSLGFSPAWQEDDRRHRVKVEMRAKGLEARHRGSFSDLSRQSEVTMLVESAQLFDLPVPGQGSFAVSFGEPAKAGYNKVVVPLRLEIPLDRVTVFPAGPGYTADLELRVAATDTSGAWAEIPVVPVEIRGEGAPGDGEVAVFETSLKLRSKTHRLLLSLYDPPSGNVLSQRLELTL
jgi:VWFA-related protein